MTENKDTRPDCSEVDYMDKTPTETMPELKPCPFCGANAKCVSHHENSYDEGRWYEIGCETADCPGNELLVVDSYINGEFHRIAAEWNTRSDLVPSKEPCPDCGCEMMEVCSGLATLCREEDAGKCPTGTKYQPSGSPFAWQDISTAPKDGTAFIAYLASGNYVCVEYGDSAVESPNHVWHTLDGISYHSEAFSHWMPLPAPPQQDGDK